MGVSQGRIGWIDEFKGLVLLLVCLYHVEQSFPCASMGMLHLGARMSAFFFISGVLFSSRRFGNFGSYLVHKTRVLLWPYIALSLLFMLLDPVIYNFDLFPKAPRMMVMNIHPQIANVKDYVGWNVAKIFVAGKSSVGGGPLWFVFTLYSVSLIFYLVQKLAGKAKGAARVIVAAVAVVALAAGWLLSQNHMRFPLGLERDLTVFFFFACGWLCRDAIKKFGRAHALAVAAVAAASLALYAYFEVPDPNFSIMNNDLGKSFVAFFASSVSGIVGLVSLFLLLDRIPGVAPVRVFKGILRNVSRNALVILAVHWWALLVMRLLFRTEINRPAVAYMSILVVVAVAVAAIPLFRCKLYKLLGKERVSVRESLSIK